MLRWVLGNTGRNKTKKSTPKPSYGEAKRIAASNDVRARRRLASHEDLEPELLYYFATDAAAAVRRAVARNDGTPLQADVLLAKDVDAEVRAELAHKIGRLVPSLDADATERLTAMAIEVLEILARDELPRVRAIVAEEIKYAANVPRHIVRRLAEDVSEIVAAPVLEYSPLLSNQDLLEIIASGVSDGALTALSRREDLVEAVVDALVAIGNVPVMKALLSNRSARISEETLDKIAVVAAGAAALHVPMVNRDNLSLGIIRRIATFVGAALVDKLIERNALDAGVARQLRQAVRKRIETSGLEDAEAMGEPPEARAKAAFDAGRLDENALIDAIDARDFDFVRHGLALLAGLSIATVEKMIASKSGKAITALAWKAGQSMDTATILQRRLGQVQPRAMISPAPGGGFAMSEPDLEWYVAFYQ